MNHVIFYRLTNADRIESSIESELNEELERTHRRANLTYEIIKLAAELLQSSEKTQILKELRV